VLVYEVYMLHVGHGRKRYARHWIDGKTCLLVRISQLTVASGRTKATGTAQSSIQILR
jgi:hypothetical protein